MDTTHPLRNATLSIETEARLRDAVLYLSRTRISATTAQTASPDARLLPDSQRFAVERPQPVRWVRNCSVRRGTANLVRAPNEIFFGPFLDPFLTLDVPRRELDGTMRRLESRPITQHSHQNRLVQLQIQLRNLAARCTLRAVMFHRGTAMHDDQRLPHRIYGPIVDPRMSRFRLHCVALQTQNSRATGGCTERHPALLVRGKLRNGNCGSLSEAASCPGLFDLLGSQTGQKVRINTSRFSRFRRAHTGPPLRGNGIPLKPLDH